MRSHFAELVDPVQVILSITADYVFSPAVLREYIQNSDDAKATEQVEKRVPLTAFLT